MTETKAQSAAASNSQKTEDSSAGSNNTLEQADNLLNAVGDKVANATGQHETVQKATAFVEEKVLNINNGQAGHDAAQGSGAVNDHVDNAGNEQIEEFLRHENRSYQG